jgi:hypothetical protein
MGCGANDIYFQGTDMVDKIHVKVQSRQKKEQQYSTSSSLNAQCPASPCASSGLDLILSTPSSSDVSECSVSYSPTIISPQPAESGRCWRALLPRPYLVGAGESSLPRHALFPLPQPNTETNAIFRGLPASRSALTFTCPLDNAPSLNSYPQQLPTAESDRDRPRPRPRPVPSPLAFPSPRRFQPFRLDRFLPCRHHYPSRRPQ